MPAKSSCILVFSSAQPVISFSHREMSFNMPARSSNILAKPFSKPLFHSTCYVKGSASYAKAFTWLAKSLTWHVKPSAHYVRALIRLAKSFTGHVKPSGRFAA